MIPSQVEISALIDQYDALFLDSFGVLVDGINALPGAVDLIQRMNDDGVIYFVVTNDSSMSIESRVHRFKSHGFIIDPERIINSGSLISGYFKKHSLQGSPTFVLGTDDARDYAISAGAEIVELVDLMSGESAQEPDIVIVGHSGPFGWKSTLETLLNLLSRRFEEQNPVRLILPNPDLIYPGGIGNFRFGAAAFVDLLEQALNRLHGTHESLVATKLGKPFSPIYLEAIRRAGSSNVVMIGDQLETDILGANRSGIASALVTTGISNRTRAEEFDNLEDELTPTYILATLV